MIAFTGKRLIALVPILLGISIVTYGLLLLTPGGPADALLPPEVTLDVRAAFEKEFHLDEPVHERYWAWLTHAVQFDFGSSIASPGRSAGDVMLAALGNTGKLAAAAALIAILVGVSIGIAAAWWANTPLDRVLNTFVVACASMPSFWIGLVLVYVFALRLGVFPTGGMGPATGDSGFLTRLEYLALPAITASLLPGAVIARLTRTLFLEVRRQEFMLALRTRGYSTLRIWRHLLRNASPGIVNIAGLQVGYLVLGTLFVEIVFSWPGLGTEIARAITYRDYPVIQAIILMTGVCFSLVTVTVDVVMRLLDPRTRAQ